MHEWTMRDHEGPRVTIRGSKVDHTGPLKIKGEHGRPCRTIGGGIWLVKRSWALSNFKVS